MDSSSHFHLSSTVYASFQKEIEAYNSKEVPEGVKTKSLEKISAIVEGVLSTTPPSQSQEAAQQVTDLLKQIDLRPKDHALWDQIMGEITKATKRSYEMPPKIPSYEKQLNVRAYYEVLELMPTEIYELIMGKAEAIERSSMKLLKDWRWQKSAEQSFQLALKCGEELTELDLRNSEGFDDAKLKQLQEACPKLRKLYLHYAPIGLFEKPPRIEKLHLSAFSRLEVFDVSRTNIKTLELPKSLKVLNLNGCENIKAEEFQQLNSLLELENLFVAGTHIKTINNLSKNLKVLNLNGCKNIPAEEFQHLNSLPALENLSVADTQIKNPNMLPKSLKELNLSRCKT